jgi:hypothetical protein
MQARVLEEDIALTDFGASGVAVRTSGVDPPGPSALPRTLRAGLENDRAPGPTHGTGRAIDQPVKTYRLGGPDVVKTQRRLLSFLTPPVGL